MALPTSEELARYTLSQQHPITRQWADPQTRLRLLANEHDLDLTLATDRTTARARRERFAPDQPDELFLNRWVRVRPDLDVLLSMRYEGGAPDRPFVDASALSRALDAAELPTLVDAARAEYGILRPSYLRWWSSRAAGHFPSTNQDKRFLAAPLGELARLPIRMDVSVRPSPDLRHYGDAQRAYEAVDRAHPEHRYQAAVESRDDLAESQQAGMLFDVMHADAWAGYVALGRGHKLGLKGYKVTEFVLADHARGHRVGPHVGRLVARNLLCREADSTDVLIGTIHPGNKGALRAATNGGRVDIGGWVTTPIISA